MSKRKVWWWVVNAVLLPVDYLVAGFAWQYAGMTISARCGVAQVSGEKGVRAWLLRLLGRGLDRLDPGHCAGAVRGDLARIERTRQRLAKWA